MTKRPTASRSEEPISPTLTHEPVAVLPRDVDTMPTVEEGVETEEKMGTERVDDDRDLAGDAAAEARVGDEDDHDAQPEAPRRIHPRSGAADGTTTRRAPH